MYNSTVLADRIKSRAKDQHIQLKDIWKKVGITDNTLTNLRKGSMLGADKLAMIADYLRCSTDYLLGRTDSPNSHYNISNSQTTINGTQANVIHNAVGSDGLTDEFMKVFAELCFDDKVSVMQYVKDIKKAPSKDGGKERKQI